MASGSQFPKDFSNNDANLAIETAAEAGKLLLENGSEISRVEETMRRISTSLGASEENFFIIGNGIFATSKSDAIVRYVPIKGSRLDKIVEISDLSHKLEGESLKAEDVRNHLKRIADLPFKPLWEQFLAVILATMGFGIVFASSLMDCLASAIAGLFLWGFYIGIGSKVLSKALGNICGGMIGTICCMILHKIGLGEHLGNMIVSTLILLIPGVAFTNGIRDIANEDYISGITRLLDALMVFFCLSLGACLIFMGDNLATGSMIMLGGPAVSPDTYPLIYQALGGFAGTVAFAVLFGVQRRYYHIIGLVGMFSWLAYVIAFRYSPLNIAGATFIGTSVVAFSSYYLAKLLKCPNTIFLICGNFPLIPGGGIFWTLYYFVSGQLRLGAKTGLLAFEITVAIVLAMIIVSNVAKRNSVNSLSKKR